MSPARLFETEIEGPTLIIAPQGSGSSLTGDNVNPEVEELLELLRRPELRNVVIDLAQVSYFGTHMLGAMHRIWRRVRERGGKMALCNVSMVGCEVLEISGVDALWVVCSSRIEALQKVGM